jgi:hypothetical protein
MCDHQCSPHMAKLEAAGEGARATLGQADAAVRRD